MDLFYALNQTMQVCLLQKGQGQTVIIVPTCSSHSMQIDIEVNISLFLW